MRRAACLRAWLSLAMVALTLPGGPVLAQRVTLEPSAALQCMTPPPDDRGEPEYPFDKYKLRIGGRVRAALVFHGNARYPSIEVVESEGGDAFVDSAKTFLHKLDVPCLPANGRARIEFEFIFVPDKRLVQWAPPIDAYDRERSKQLGCLTRIDDSKQPAYPRAALLSSIQGRILAQMRFVTPDGPPEVKVFARANLEDLGRAAQRWALGYRLPCFAGEPVTLETKFIFRIEGDAYGFKPLTLLQFMGSVKGIRERGAQFDTNEMGCPFDLKLEYRQPYLGNHVGEVGGTHPGRRPLLEWLAAAQLDVPSRQLDSLFGDIADLTVPCVKLDLKPKEKS